MYIYFSPSSRLGPSMWVSWWTKRGQGRFFSGFLPFSPTTNFIPPFLHTHLIHFVSFHQPLWWCFRRGQPAPLLFIDLQYRGFIASHPSTRPCVGHELRIFIFHSLICLIDITTEGSIPIVKKFHKDFFYEFQFYITPTI